MQSKNSGKVQCMLGAGLVILTLLFQIGSLVSLLLPLGIFLGLGLLFKGLNDSI
ncbi:MAG: hypothetical protein K2W95_29465 [Candidatus Obscuribacterales bacterium]|nr:hypothetical protein [Candidatus Obscuribacterales bacterium]